MDKLNDLLIVYEAALLKECWKYYKNREDVLDLFQDASVKMARNFHTFDDTKKFLPWARIVIKSAHGDQLRAKEKEFKDISVYNRQHLDSLASVEPEIGESVEILLNLVDKETANLLQSVYVDGVSITSLAKIEGISHQAMSKRVAKARKRFKEVYDEFFESHHRANY